MRQKSEAMEINDDDFNENNTDNFEKVIESTPTNSLIQNFLETKQIFDQEHQSFICITPGEEYQPLRIFWNVNFEEYNYPTVFFGEAHLFKLEAKHFNQKIAKIELTSVDIKFAYRIANIFFKVIKILIHFVLSSSWVHVCKA